MKQSLHYCLSCYSSSIHYERERERERERKREREREREGGRESTPCRPDWCWSNMQRWRNVGNGSLRYPSNICTVSGLAAIMCMASYIPRCWPFNSLAIRQSISSAMRFAFFYYNYAVPGMHVTLWACVIIV